MKNRLHKHHCFI